MKIYAVDSINECCTFSCLTLSFSTIPQSVFPAAPRTAPSLSSGTKGRRVIQKSVQVTEILIQIEIKRLRTFD
jgi:hypothetical protein